jgi:hypothetical protein
MYLQTINFLLLHEFYWRLFWYRFENLLTGGLASLYIIDSLLMDAVHFNPVLKL